MAQTETKGPAPIFPLMPTLQEKHLKKLNGNDKNFKFQNKILYNRVHEVVYS
jgi:hypothetical protein